MQEQTAVQDLVYAICAAPDGALFAARQSGLARSDDGGRSWRALVVLPENDAQPSISALALASTTEGQTHIFAGVTGGVFVSHDGGGLWKPTPIAAPPPFITVLAVSPDYARDGIAFATSMEDGVYRSDDYGASWRAWGFGLFDFHVLGLAVSPHFATDKTVYALTESGIYRSRNTGRSWQVTGFPADGVPALCMAVAPDNTLYAGTERAGLYRSSDSGDTWEQMPTFPPDDAINAVLLGTGEMLVLTSSAAWRSTDAGRSWQPAFTDVDFGDGLTAALAPRGLGEGLRLLLGFADGRILTLAQPYHV